MNNSETTSVSSSKTLLSRFNQLPSISIAIALKTLGLLVLLLLWSVGVHYLQKSLPMAAMLAPKEAFESLYQLISQGSVTSDIIASLRRVAISLALALAIGIPIGLAVGSSKVLDTTTSGAFQFLRMISPLSWMPVAVMVFGIGDAPIYFLLTMTAVWPIILNTAAGVRALDSRWLSLAQSLSATPLEVLFKVILPGIMGNILTGVRLAIGIIWVLLVPCEMLGVTSGLGYFILDTRDRLAYSELMAVIILIGILGYMIDSLARKVQHYWAAADD